MIFKLIISIIYVTIVGIVTTFLLKTKRIDLGSEQKFYTKRFILYVIVMDLILLTTLISTWIIGE